MTVTTPNLISIQTTSKWKTKFTWYHQSRTQTNTQISSIAPTQTPSPSISVPSPSSPSLPPNTPKSSPPLPNTSKEPNPQNPNTSTKPTHQQASNSAPKASWSGVPRNQQANNNYNHNRFRTTHAEHQRDSSKDRRTDHDYASPNSRTPQVNANATKQGASRTE
jgi:hypothetical protein